MILKTVRTIRNHWKKSLFGSTVISYGIVYAKNSLETHNLMHAYCQKAALYGSEPLPPNVKARHVTVILNPNANKRKSTKEFEKYCAPLFHLAGIFVEIIKTESEGHAKTLIDTLHATDAIVVAGGDGTLSEVVTGLLRKTEENASHLIPIGILPLGKSNRTAKLIFSSGTNLEKVKSLANAALAVIEQVTKPVDIMKIEILEDSNKPVYALNSLTWGAYRDADFRKDNYWFFGPLRKYATYIFNGVKNNLSWNCDAILDYNLPCEGCSNCYKKNSKVQHTSWFHKFVKTDNAHTKFASIINPDCSRSEEKKISTIDLCISVNNPKDTSDHISKLVIEIGPDNINYLDFIKNGIKIEKGEKEDIKEVVEARLVKLNPQNVTDNSWFSIDNEEYEVKPVKITVLPKLLNMFYPNRNT